MASFGEGLQIGSNFIGGVQDRRQKREEFELRKAKQEAINAANEQAQKVMQQIAEAQQAEQQDKAAAFQAVQPLPDIVGRKPGPQRMGDVEVYAEKLKAQGVELSPIARRILEKEPSETALPMARQVQQQVTDDPQPSFKKYGEMLQSNEQSSQLFNFASKAAKQQQLVGRKKPDPERKRKAEIEILKSQNKRLQQSMASLPSIGGAAPIARNQINLMITRNQFNIDRLQKTEVVKGVGGGEGQLDIEKSQVIFSASGSEIKELGRKRRQVGRGERQFSRMVDIDVTDASGKRVTKPFIFDTRSKTLEEVKIPGSKVSSPKFSPTVQGAVAQAKAGGKVLGKERTTAKINFPKIKSNARVVKGVVRQILKHPGFKSVVGAPSVGKVAQFVGGTKEAAFSSLMKQLTGKQFIQQYQDVLKGGGQITEIEGTKATEAVSRLTTKLPEKDFKEAAKEFITEMDRLVLLAEQRASGRAPPGVVPPPTAIDFLKNNDSPEFRKAFIEKYGGLPAGL